ncbi:MAG: Transfer Agent terminase protein [Devosia sp.]|uniref:DNA-packaging protein n=1 Tax=Devosia sp. TaxID=1871048 RepID=UPI00262692CC|nr:terminase family protein [Devosia sp.]MDB5541082.1 Transfer Agent terminase protein [Devosia sp.]
MPDASNNSEISERLAAGLSVKEARDAYYSWPLLARDEQWPPRGDWTTWLLVGGRGSGKTRAGAEWIRRLAWRRVSPLVLVGETIVEAIDVMVKGPSGVLRVHPPEDRPLLRGNRLIWSNGVEALILGASDPERFRGPQFAAAWCDELAKWPKAEAAWDMLQFGLRLGDRPRQLVTTTPRATRLMKRLMGEPETATTHMTTRQNDEWLANSFLRAVVARYTGSVLGRQELEGELIEDRPDALWTRSMFRAAADEGALERIVVAVDPPVSGHQRSDACGIVVAGRVGEGAVVLADLSFAPAAPDAWARRAVSAFHEYGADCIVAEVNQGGDMVKAVIAQEDADVPVRAVRASRGKWVRAEPVAALYANGRVAHRPGLVALEDEMCAFGADGLAEGRSPDRVDALVWALTELMAVGAAPRVRGT